MQLELHYITLHYTTLITLRYTTTATTITLRYTTLQLQLRLHYLHATTH